MPVFSSSSFHRVFGHGRPLRYARPATVVSVVCAFLLVVAVTSAVWYTSRAPAAKTAVGVAPPSSGSLFGATAYSSGGVTETGLEAAVGRTMAVDRVYSQWDDAQPANQAKADANVGRTTLLSIRPQYRNGTKIPWASVAAGDQDAAIRTQIAGIETLNRPIMLSFHHEADLSSGYGTPADFRAAFAHFVTVARATGETNISFVLVLSAYNYGPSQIPLWYPGDDVVDWAGADAYNFGACTPGRPPWRTFAQAVANFRTWGQSHTKPQVLAEWGTAEDPADTNAKPRWITDAGTQMQSWTQLHAAAYFDEPGSCDWSLDTSTASTAAFATLARSAYANGAATAGLRATTLTGTTQQWTGSPSTGASHTTGSGVTTWSFAPGDASATRFGTGQPAGITYTYPKTGTYTAVLTVQDTTGASATTRNTVTIR